MTVWHITAIASKSFTASDIYRAHAAKFSSEERVPAVLEVIARVPRANYNALIIVPEYFH